MKDFLLHLLVPHESNNHRARLIHPTGLSLVIGCYVVLQLVLGSFSNRYPSILGYASNIAPEEIVRLTNMERKSKGLPEVRLDTNLSAAAAQKAADMVAHDYWAHVSPQGTQPWYFVTNSGYAYKYAGENLARDFADPDSVVRAWMNSPTHRENLLSSRYQDIGIAVIDGSLGGRETTLVVQMFGTKLNSGGSILSVKAADEAGPSATRNWNPTITRFDLAKALSIGLLLLFSAILVVDVVVISKHKIHRWTSKSFAHLTFLAVLLVGLFIINRGVIL
jgi:hypothetical protein